MVRPKDYEVALTVEARSPYAAWLDLKESPDALQPGDILESENGELRIYKYVGFEQAQWQLPEVKVEANPPQPSPDAPVSMQGVVS